MGFVPTHEVRDADYLLRRAAAEADMARDARCHEAADAHQRIASTYLGKLFGASPTMAPADGAPAEDMARLLRVRLRRVASPVPPDMQALLDTL